MKTGSLVLAVGAVQAAMSLCAQASIEPTLPPIAAETTTSRSPASLLQLDPSADRLVLGSFSVEFVETRGLALRTLTFAGGVSDVPARCVGGQQEGKQGNASAIPAEYRLTITGRVLDERKSPIEGLSVMIFQVSDTDLKTGTFSVTLSQGKASKLWNPMTRTDGSGRFTLVTDRRDWEETQRVALNARLFAYPRNYEGVVSNSTSSTPVVIKVETGPKRLPTLNLGDVVFRVR